MKITINDKEITLKYGFRAMMIYERITGETFVPKGLTETLMFLCSTILASDKDTDLTFDSYMDMIDENPQIVIDFTDFLTKKMRISKFVASGDEETEGNTEVKKNEG